MESVEVHILGQKYVLKHDNSSPEHIKEVAELVDKKLQEVYTNAPNMTPVKAAILAALNIADELCKTRDEYNSISTNIKKIEHKADSIIRLFD